VTELGVPLLFLTAFIVLRSEESWVSIYCWVNRESYLKVPCSYVMVGFRVQASEDIFEHVITPLIANRIYKLPAVIQEKSTLHENLGGLEVIIQNEI